MKSQSVKLIAVGVIAGIGIAVLAGRLRGGAGLEMRAVASPVGANPDAREIQSHWSVEAMERAPDDREEGPVMTPDGPLTIEESVRRALAWAEERATGKLLSAGFTVDRINWIRRRADELQVEQARASHERQRQGLPPDPDAIAYILDPDLDLREEIGIEEYERYREALGRSAGIIVTDVLPTSNAEAAGLRPGDEIVSYDGRRTFNSAELNALVSKAGPGEYAIIGIRRDGQTIQLSVPRGPLSIQSAMPMPYFTGRPPPSWRLEGAP